MWKREAEGECKRHGRPHALSVSSRDLWIAGLQDRTTCVSRIRLCWISTLHKRHKSGMSKRRTPGVAATRRGYTARGRAESPSELKTNLVAREELRRGEDAPQGTRLRKNSRSAPPHIPALDLAYRVRRHPQRVAKSGKAYKGGDARRRLRGGERTRTAAGPRLSPTDEDVRSCKWTDKGGTAGDTAVPNFQSVRLKPELETPRGLWAGDEPTGLAAGWESKQKTQMMTILRQANLIQPFRLTTARHTTESPADSVQLYLPRLCQATGNAGALLGHITVATTSKPPSKLCYLRTARNHVTIHIRALEPQSAHHPRTGRWLYSHPLHTHNAYSLYTRESSYQAPAERWIS
ncbi:hypothetical protein B0H17DRAFT_1232830 [Mycena rosella]|uniref:Uncharacterized protein n=1 Tax=Mycena rosella TaxID=1033263 RepID=A0AAD7D6N8_MYCRO|nr:hypothetical protein B0H17DRAFT_1232830 [Mycena rosella]